MTRAFKAQMALLFLAVLALVLGLGDSSASFCTGILIIWALSGKQGR